MKECISKAGVATTRRKSSEGSVILRARVRVARSMVFEISHRISSTSTAERAKLVENMRLASEVAVGRKVRKNEALSRWARLEGRGVSCCALRCAWPDRMGNSLCDTTKATPRKVRMKGKAEMATARGLGWRA